MARFDFLKYVEDGHLQRDAAAAAARAKQEAKALGLPPAGLTKDGKRMCKSDRNSTSRESEVAKDR